MAKKAKARRAGRVVTTSDGGVWVHRALGDWLVRARMAVQGGRLVIAELHIGPVAKRVSPGGVTHDVVRGLPLGRFGPLLLADHRFTRDSGIGGLKEHHDRTVGAALPGLEAAAERPRPRRESGRDDAFYARVAADYLQRISEGSRSPVKELAKARKVPVSRARDMVHEARVRGLLSRSESGRVGGRLLPRARRLLGQRGGRRTR